MRVSLCRISSYRNGQKTTINSNRLEKLVEKSFSESGGCDNLYELSNSSNNENNSEDHTADTSSEFESE